MIAAAEKISAQKSTLLNPKSIQHRTEARPEQALIMEAVAHLYCYHSWIVYVRTAKAVAAINEVALVGEICGGDFRRPLLTEGASQGHVNGCVSGQMARAVAVKEAGPRVHVAGDPGFFRERAGESDTQRVPLVVVEKERAFLRRREVGQPAGNASRAFHR